MPYTIKNFITSDTRIQGGDKRLSICLSANGFSFSEMSLGGKLLAAGEVECDMPRSVATMLSQLREIFAKLSMNLPLYAETVVIEPVDKFTWVPEHLFKKGNEKQYLQLLCSFDPKADIKTDYSEKTQAYCLFVSENPVVQAIKILAPNATIRCQHTVLAESRHLIERSLTKPVVAVNVRENHFDMAVFSEQKLILSNTFASSSKAEVLYTLLNVLNHTQIKKDEAEVLISGAVDRDWYQYMRPYFTKLGLNNGHPVQYANDDLRRVHIYKYALTLS